MHFLDIDKNIFAAGALLQLALELVYFRALASDNDSRPRRLDDDAQLVARPLDLNRIDVCRFQLVFQFGLQLDVFVQLLVVIPLGKPVRFLWFRKAEAKPVRMDFLSHCIS